MIKQVKFISIPVRDQNRALDFYTDKLGFTIITDQPFDGKQRWIELRIPKAETRVVLFTPCRAGRPGRLVYEPVLRMRRHRANVRGTPRTRSRLRGPARKTAVGHVSPSSRTARAMCSSYPRDGLNPNRCCVDGIKPHRRLADAGVMTVGYLDDSISARPDRPAGRAGFRWASAIRR